MQLSFAFSAVLAATASAGNPWQPKTNLPDAACANLPAQHLSAYQCIDSSSFCHDGRVMKCGSGTTCKTQPGGAAGHSPCVMPDDPTAGCNLKVTDACPNDRGKNQSPLVWMSDKCYSIGTCGGQTCGGGKTCDEHFCDVEPVPGNPCDRSDGSLGECFTTGGCMATCGGGESCPATSPAGLYFARGAASIPTESPTGWWRKADRNTAPRKLRASPIARDLAASPSIVGRRLNVAAPVAAVAAVNSNDDTNDAIASVAPVDDNNNIVGRRLAVFPSIAGRRLNTAYPLGRFA